MAANGIEVKGLREFREKLAAIPRAMRRSILLKALSYSMRVVRDEAKRSAPVLAASSRKTPYRKPGTVRRAIAIRTSRAAREAGDIGVFVNVKPLPGNKYSTERTGFNKRTKRIRYRLIRLSQRSAKNPRDPFYWRFLEFGTRFMRKRPFLAPGAAKLPQALARFEGEIAAWTKAMDASGRVNG